MEASRQQYGLDFTSRQNELIAMTSALYRVTLFVNGKRLSMGRVYGVVDLLKRLLCLVPHGTPIEGDRLVVVAQVPYLAQRMTSFRCVAERTVRDWSRDARALGLVEVEYRSQALGGRHWNEWSIRLDALRELAGSGRQRAAMVADPHIRDLNPGEEITSRPGPGAAGPARSSCDLLPEWEELSPFRETRIEPLSDEETAWLSTEVSDSLIGKRAFEPLTERWLKSDRAMRVWHAWQLRMADPAVGPTRAHQLLVVAAARHATSIPQSRIHRSRVGLFVGICSKRIWEPARCRLVGVLADMMAIA